MFSQNSPLVLLQTPFVTSNEQTAELHVSLSVKIHRGLSSQLAPAISTTLILQIASALHCPSTSELLQCYIYKSSVSSILERLGLHESPRLAGFDVDCEWNLEVWCSSLHASSHDDFEWPNVRVEYFVDELVVDL